MSKVKQVTNSRDVWVFVEQEEGEIASVSLELLTKGRDLADQLDGRLCGVLLGHQIEPLAQTAIHHGADLVLLADHAELAPYRTLPYARMIVDLVQENQPYIFLIGATPTGRDLAPRVASAVRAGLTADCTALQIGDFERKGEKHTDLLYQIRPAFGGNVVATIVNPHMHPQMATVREGVMHLGEPDPARKGEIQSVKPKFEPQDTVLQVLERETRPPTCDLRNASIIVAGGAGVGSAEEFDLIRQLAQVVGGEVGASRAAVDAGYISQEHQIGQTGSTVRPRLYIACGISGAVQHRAGMDQAGTIVAINSDPDAPIFDIAHYKVVGDLKEVIPQMISAYRELPDREG
jgi:electron transfer flavoprotein alpha subunit